MIITDSEFDVSSLNKGKVSYNWNSWTIEKFTIHGGAVFSAKGAIRNGKYGYLETIEVDSSGSWHL